VNHDLLRNYFNDALDAQWAVHLLLVSAVRLGAAVVLGAVVGWERQIEGKAAGIRTHMCVSLGAAMFMLASLMLNDNKDEATKVIQGVAAGVGFLGAGTILKLSDVHEVKGLTSAASIWLSAAIGMTVGAGLLWPSILGCFLAWVILSLIHATERWVKLHHKDHKKHGGHEP
jgi:putative Mg2+ transporter-C (MgtC) family protein